MKIIKKTTASHTKRKYNRLVEFKGLTFHQSVDAKRMV